MCNIYRDYPMPEMQLFFLYIYYTLIKQSGIQSNRAVTYTPTEHVFELFISSLVEFI